MKQPVKKQPVTNPTDEVPAGMTFPCRVDVKVFGRADDTLKSKIETVLKQHLSNDQVGSIRSKESTKGNYQSFRCEVQVSSKEQIDQVFIALNAHPDVVLVL